MLSIEIHQVSKRFGITSALNDISLSVAAGQRLMLLGPSGAGKTTLLRILAGLETPDQGIVKIAGEDILSQLPTARSLAMVSQDYALYPQLSIRRNLETALQRCKLDQGTSKRRIDQTLEWFEIPHLAGQLPSQLSGGEAQRAALAKAVVTRPKVLLLDEPLSQVDGILKIPLTELIRDITVQYDCSTVMVTHDPLDAMQLADTIGILDRGLLLEHGVPSELYRSPKSKVAANLLSPLGMNWFDLESSDGEPVLKLSQHPRKEISSRFVGFRPEDFEWSADDATKVSQDDLQIQAKVTEMRNLGFAQLVIGDWHGHRLRLLKRHGAEQESLACGRVASEKLIWVAS